MSEKVLIDKKVLFGLIISHSRLAQAEYNRNPAYNDAHFSYIAERDILTEMGRLELTEELFKAM